MEGVQQFVTHLIQTDRFGGRVIIRDGNTVLLYDVPRWGEEHARAVRARFPECGVSYMANGHSMSGFVVIVTRQSQPRAQIWASVFVLALAGAAYTCLRASQLLLAVT